MHETYAAFPITKYINQNNFINCTISNTYLSPETDMMK